MTYWFNTTTDEKKSSDNDLFDQDFEQNVGTDDIQHDQRVNDRLLNDLHDSGYRDGYQNKMEDQVYMQRGFNCAYHLNSKIGFLFGYIRGICEYMHVMSHDQAYKTYICRLNEIETKIKTHNYEDIIKKLENLDDNLDVNEELRQLTNNYYQHLIEFKETLLLLLTQQQSNSQSIEGLIDDLTSKLANI